MYEKAKDFIRGAGITVGDAPMTVDEAKAVLDLFKNKYVMCTACEIEPEDLAEGYNELLNERYDQPGQEPLQSQLDGYVYKELRGLKFLFDDALEEPITYTDAWYAVDEWRNEEMENGVAPEDCLPPWFTALVYMRYVNSHHNRIKDCRLWIVENYETGATWYGPFESLDYLCKSSQKPCHVVYRYTDYILDGDEITVDEWHSIVYRDPGFIPPN